MSILIDKHSRVITQGMTGKMGRFHTALCRDYGSGSKCFVGGVNPRKGGTQCDGLPVFGSVKEAKAKTGATVSVVYVPAASAADAIDEAVGAGIELIVCITAGISAADMDRIRRRVESGRTLLVGPNCPGLITPEEIKIGILPGHLHQRGRIGVVSRSPALASETARQLGSFGIGQSTVVGVGSDPAGGLTHVDVLKLFNEDAHTDAVIMVGEVTGDAEERAASWIRDHMRKPVVGFIAQGTANVADAAALAGAEHKLAAMEACGIHVTRNPADIGTLLASLVIPDYLPFD
ncbi:succinate--CoA ligase subunit alpha [Variovorax sp. JS1663]|uniref:succinate--CoA ligase subunit alpha n=1 Tax=Variovorax sp. JS1663 TaxID=1851577 RepID=UPI000B346780|nr:succinate--CoA ligase subunit alpha [Variovorax sp. JS1663]OUM03738.1 succinate--CoA ligase subunit alpha [Variovorax sp. JS1663]